MKSNGKETIWNRDFILLLTINAFVFISMHMLSTTIAKFAMSLNGTEAIAGVVAGIFSAASIAVRPVCGVLADRSSKKLLYLAAILCIFLSMLGYSAAANNTTVMAFRLLHGVGWGFATTIGMTMATDTAPESKIGECTSVYGLANVLAMAIAPSIGNYLSDAYGYRIMFFSAAVVVALAFAMLIPVKETRNPNAQKKDRIRLNDVVVKEAVFPAAALFLYGMVYSAITAFLIIYSKEAGIEKPSIFFTIYSVCILVVRLCSGKIVDTKGPEFILVPGAFFFVGCLLLLSNLKETWMLYGAAVCLGLGYSPNLSTLMAVSFKRTGRQNRGAVSSTINIGMDLGQGIGSSVAGLVALHFGYSALYAVLIIPVIMAIALFLADQRCYKGKMGFYRETGVLKQP